MKALVKLLSILGIGVLVALNTSCSQARFSTVKKGDLYYSGYQELEFRDRVVIVDTGLRPELLVAEYMCKDVAQISDSRSLVPKELHGTTVTSIVAQDINYKDYCITMIKLDLINKVKNDIPLESYTLINQLHNVKYVNMSYRWPKYNHQDYLEIKKGIESGIIYIAAAGNERADIGAACTIYPACYARLLEREEDPYNSKRNYLRSRFKIVGAIANYTNYGSVVDVYLTGTDIGTPPSRGTSMAAAEYTGMMVRK